MDGAGFGIDRPAELSREDDEYEAFRKRMMLAYRFRPNPLVRGPAVVPREGVQQRPVPPIISLCGAWMGGSLLTLPLASWLPQNNPRRPYY